MVTTWLARAGERVLAWWRGDSMSPRWRRVQAQREARIDVHGVPWRWPVHQRHDHEEAA